MTRATHRPLRRLVDGGALGRIVVEVRADTITFRPYRSRKPLLVASYATVVRATLLAQAPTRRRRPRRVRRGVLALDRSA